MSSRRRPPSTKCAELLSDFDVVPSDCLAAKEPSRRNCLLPPLTEAGVSWLAGLTEPGRRLRRCSNRFRRRPGEGIRRAHLNSARLEDTERSLPRGPPHGVAIPRGETSPVPTTPRTEYEVYAATAAVRRCGSSVAHAPPALGLRPIRAHQRRINASVHGPTPEKPANARRCGPRGGRTLEATLTTPNGYALTISTTALAAIEEF